MFSPKSRTSTRGDKFQKGGSRSSLSQSKEILNAEDSPTVRQRLAEARRSGCLDLSGQNLSMLPEGVLELEGLRTMLLGSNNFTSVPANLALNFPQLLYLDLSSNKISSIPSNLADLPDIRIIDFSGNADLDGSKVPPSFGPRAHEVAVFVDNPLEIGRAKGGEDEGDVDEGREVLSRKEKRRNRKGPREARGEDVDEHDAESMEQDDNKDQEPENSDDDEEEEEEDDEDEEGSDIEQPKRRMRDHMEDVALQSHRFFHRLETLPDSADLEPLFRRLLDTKDPEFIKYLLKRYKRVDIEESGGAESDYSASEDGSPDRGEKISARRELKEQNGAVRRERDRLAKGERDFGRKSKTDKMRGDD
ncbi:hypothetical protein HDV05_003270 [Chytridiales sp. JEL 0842]|nr:hypothetical protein HDV05_003270 [Chytridiales sp. JEL 0842]